MIKIIGYILDINLPAIETLLLLTIGDFADERGFCTISEKTLSKRSRVKRRTVNKYLYRLEAYGWLEEFTTGKGDRSFQLNLNKIYKEGFYPIGREDLGGGDAELKLLAVDDMPLLENTTDVS